MSLLHGEQGRLDTWTRPRGRQSTGGGGKGPFPSAGRSQLDRPIRMDGSIPKRGDRGRWRARTFAAIQLTGGGTKKSTSSCKESTFRTRRECGLLSSNRAPSPD